LKVALDEGVPEGLIEHLSGHDVQSVRQLGWKGVKNGQLLTFIERTHFDAFITNDKKMEAEGQLCLRPFAILILSATNWNLIKPPPAPSRMRWRQQSRERSRASMSAGLSRSNEDTRDGRAEREAS
jgi:hypothetical protein